MDFIQLQSLSHLRIDELAELFKVSRSLTFTQSKINLLVGHSLRFHTTSKVIKSYLEFLPLLDCLEIKGLPLPYSQEYLLNYIENYYKNLAELQQLTQGLRIKQGVIEKLSIFIQENVEKCVRELTGTLKNSEKSRVLAVINGWNSVEINKASALHVFDCFFKVYVDECKIGAKNELVLVAFFRMFLKILQSHSQIIEERYEKVIILFKKAQGICRKYITNKVAKEKIFLLACEFIIFSLCQDFIVENGLEGIKLPILLGKSYLAETFLCYFLKQTYQVLHRANMATRLLLTVKDFIIEFLRKNLDYVPRTLSTFNGFLKISEEPEMIVTIIKVIQDIFKVSDGKMIKKYLIPYLLNCRQELNYKVSSDLIYYGMKIVPEKYIKNLNTLFINVHLDMEEEEIQWTVKALKGFKTSSKVTEIIKALVLNYKRAKNQKTLNEIIKALTSLSENFADIITEEILSTVAELLILSEKNRWIYKSNSYTPLITNALTLLGVIKSCKKHLLSDFSSSKPSEFWYIISHYHTQYELNQYISLIDLNETLQIIANLTQDFFSSTLKESQSIFTQLSQTDQYTQFFTPKVKTELSILCSKKVLEQFDYQTLIILASFKWYLELSDREKVFSQLFEYFALESLPYYPALTEIITRLIQDHWKEVVKSGKIPIQESLQLFKYSLSQNNTTRHLATKLISGSPDSLSSHFHTILYNPQCLSTILDIISCLHYQSNFEYSSTIPTIHLPHSNTSLLIPSYKSALSEILKFFEDFFKSMFIKCLWQAPHQLQSSFQFHIYTSNKIMKKVTDGQIAGLINYSQHFFNQCFYSTQLLPSHKFPLIESYLKPGKFNSWFKQQKFSMKVQNRDQSFVHLQSNFLLAVENYEKDKGEVLSGFINMLRGYSAEDLHTESKKIEVFDCFGKITAYLILNQTQPMPSELVQVPLLAGSSAGVFYWEWLIYLNPNIHSSLLQELSLTWVSFLRNQGFLYSLKGLSYEFDLLQGNFVKVSIESKNLKKVLDLVQFIQKQAYSIGKELGTFKYIIKILKNTFEHKPSFNVFSSDFGVEACLRLIETVIDLFSFIEDPGLNQVFAAMVEFMLSLFRGKHGWVKSSTFTQAKRIRSLFEKAVKGLSEVKFEQTEVFVYKINFFDLPSPEPVEKSEIFYEKLGKKVKVSVNKEKIELLIAYLYSSYQKFVAWNSTQQIKLKSCPKISKVSKLQKLALSIDPALNLLKSKPPKSGPFTKFALGSSKDEKLFLFNHPHELPLILNHLSSENPAERSFFLKFLARSPERNQLYCIPQVLQCGFPQNIYSSYNRIEGEEDIWTYFTNAAQKSSVFLNQLIWMLEVSLFNPDQDLSSTLGHHFYNKTLEIIKKNPEEWEVYNTESEYFEKFLQISASLTPKDPENFTKINFELEKLSKIVPANVYIPTNPENLVVGLRSDNGRPLQSAKRTPILITFLTCSKDSTLIHPTQCIFKVNDDVRNDQLCLQIIDLMQDILSKTGLSIYLRPYKVISTITHTSEGNQLSGIIECIPNCKSRDEIGKEGTESLYTYFLEKFGAENSENFQKAKSNFIASMAGYAVASYLLQIKDRHNGNILIDEFGHIVHIDFGFILKISPAGNLRFERPGFKLTEEMIDVMGSRNSESFEYFKSLIIKGYLAIREHASSFITLISLMEHSGLTCFRKGAVTDFIKRFYLKMSVLDAVKKMNEKILRANNSFFTLWYDRIQLMQQQIEY